MFVFFKILQEGFLLALQELWANKLRSFLSVLGISIGIFCVISVLMMVESLQRNVKSAFSALGDDVVFIDRFPWDGGGGIKWWELIQRPHPNFRDFKAVQEVSTASSSTIRIIVMNKDLKNRNNSVEGIAIAGASHEFSDVFDLKVELGRYFTSQESSLGSNAIVLGATLAENLFPYTDDPTGREIKAMGRKMLVVGVLEKEGESLLGDGTDQIAFVPYNYLRRYIDVNSRRVIPLIAVKAQENVSLEQLKEDLTGALRASRKLKPKEGDNFALNQVSLLNNAIDQVFGLLSSAGWLIGGFSMLVGGFGIANIMFVSVKERTNIIGIKKSLGAKNHFILFEFLIESICLCLLGGIIGLAIIGLGVLIGNFLIAQYAINFELVLSIDKIMTGLLAAMLIGVIAGFVPAFNASRLSPVEAIRSK